MAGAQGSMNQIILRLPWPPSINHYWRRATRRRGNKKIPGMMLTEHGRAYKDQVALICVVARIAHRRLDAHLSVDMVLYPPDNRRRDIDNYRKAPWDALTRAGVWIDDEQVVCDTCIRAKPVKHGAIVMRIQEAGEQDIPEWAVLEEGECWQKGLGENKNRQSKSC